AVRPADGRLGAVAQQTARFERLAQRYREALAGTDPAALALLERICLFRLGVDADLLAQIFTGPGKDDLSLTWPGCPPPRLAPGWLSSRPCPSWKRRSPARPAGGSDRCALYEILAQFGAEISSGIPLFSGYVSGMPRPNGARRQAAPPCRGLRPHDTPALPQDSSKNKVGVRKAERAA